MAVGMVVAALGVAGGFAVLVRQSRGRVQAVPLPLAVFSLALLFLITPVPLVALASIRRFQAIASAGHAAAPDAARLALGILRPLTLGCLGFVAALAAAVGIQAFGGQPPGIPEEVSPGPGGGTPAWAGWLLGLSLLLVVPVGALVDLTRGLAPLFVEARTALTPDPHAVVAGMDLKELSEFVARRLLLGTVGGFCVTAVTAGSAIASIAAHRRSTTSAALDRLSEGVVWVGGVLGVGTLVVLTIGIRSIERLAG